MASSIVPRWEWRTFGDSFGAAEVELTQWVVSGASQSDEQYLVTADGDNVKIRDDLLDIKVLREVAHRGLERWEPTLKASFPLDRPTVGTLYAALRCPLPPLSRDAYSEAELLSDLIDATETIRIVHVHKRRARYTLGDCMCELTELEVDGKPNRTLAIESVEPALVTAQVAAFGLEHRVNTSVPRALLEATQRG
jgi:exopolyphosphatase/guanosine-5'-triphosphate,3'-diphosphate pyrophosphatase